ncbi:MAG: nucleotidyl transferase AbiEii/AbiGii toxin family protein [Opitutaceae bacterium]|nr:nucleotidyl transferase AbiEii/AbiGii toxin family protein [Opitutaceae bacterium]
MTREHLANIFNALSTARVRFLVVGGLAVAAHGHPRLTMDLDLVIGLDRENVLRAMRALGGLGYHPRIPVHAEAFAVPANREQWSREKGMMVFQLISTQQPETDVNIFVSEPFDFSREYADAAHMELLDGVVVPVVQLPTLLAMKRAAGRPRDLQDVLELEQGRQDPSADRKT